MPNSGDVVDLDLGIPEGREAGFLHTVRSSASLHRHPPSRPVSPRRAVDAQSVVARDPLIAPESEAVDLGGACEGLDGAR